MKKGKKRQIGQNWTAILKKFGTPEPPGYKETIAKLYPKEDNHDT